MQNAITSYMQRELIIEANLVPLLVFSPEL